LIPGTVSLAIPWISSLSSFVHIDAQNFGCQHSSSPPNSPPTWGDRPTLEACQMSTACSRKTSRKKKELKDKSYQNIRLLLLAHSLHIFDSCVGVSNCLRGSCIPFPLIVPCCLNPRILIIFTHAQHSANNQSYIPPSHPPQPFQSNASLAPALCSRCTACKVLLVPF
jgi:hypothetical protein